MCISTGANVSPAPFIEQSAMLSGYGKGRSRDRGMILEEDVVHLEQ